MDKKEIEKKRKIIIEKFKNGAISSREANKMMKELYKHEKNYKK